MLVGFKAQNHPQQPRKDAVDDRWTPPEIFDPLHAEYDFTLDVAASVENAKCAAYYTLEQDGLSQPWTGRVWCNPPYSNIGAWVEKAWKAMMTDAVESITMLLPANRTEQKWWQNYVEPYRDGGRVDWGIDLSVRFLPGRPRFFRPSGQLGGPKGDRPPFGCCLLTWTRTCPT